MYKIKQLIEKLRIAEVGVLFFLLASLPAVAQITPDATLPSNSLVANQGNISIINGGSRAGSNLFHSFNIFSVPTGNTAFFNNAVGIQNIISRVTGGTISNIDGLIRTNGTANLFLLNPNGIVFGPNASLNIGGSFVASTASAINFADGTQYNAKTPQSTHLLTVSVPLGLQFEGSPGAIRVQDIGHDLRASGTSSATSPLLRGNSPRNGLRVQMGKTLALVGGDINLEGGILTAESGRIELGGVEAGLVNLSSANSSLTLGYQDVPSFRDIQLSQRSLADASGVASGSIKIQGRLVSLRDGSVFLIQNQGLLPAGALSVNASDSLQISGTDPIARVIGSLVNETLGFGDGGDILLSAPQLIIQNGGTITTRTFGKARAGNITVYAPELLQVMGASPRDFRVPSAIFSSTLGSGGSGDVTVSTGQFTAAGGGRLASATNGNGAGGNVTLEASNSVILTGVEPNSFAPSTIAATTLSSGDAGKVTIKTPRLILQNGGRVDSSTVATGNAGSIAIEASEFVNVIGTVPGSRNPSLIISSANTVDETLQRILVLPLNPSGASGNVTINTGRLSVTNGGQISVRNDGSGNAGELKINANFINLVSQGGITASTQSGQGGDIKINSGNSLVLRGNGTISAEARSTGNGGNIIINANTLAALEKSNITANAQGGTGGRVTVNTQGLFLSPDSAITATSERGPQFNGIVQINTPDVDPSRGVLKVPTVPVNITGLIAQGCPANVGPRAGKFTVTGRSGIPESPNEMLNGETILSGLRWLDTSASVQKQPSSPVSTESTSPSNPDGARLVPATGWVFSSKGEVTLIASAPRSVTDIPWMSPTACHVQ